MSMAGSVALMRLLDATLVAYAVHGVAAFSDVGGIAAWCRVNRIPRATLYRHLARIRDSGSWEPLSRAPKSHRNATDPVLVAAILGLRDRLGADNGAVTIGCHLTRDPALAGERIPCPATIHKILVRHGRVVPEPKKKPRSAWRRFAYARPRDCYQIDATNVALADGAKVVVFEVLDDATRMLVATRAAMAETAAGAIEAITAAFTDFGVPAIVLSDNGTAFTARSTGPGKSRFTRLVTGHGARLIHSSPYHPQTCGKVERHHRTFKNWLATHPAPATLQQLQQRCTTYQHWYNTVRPHSANPGSAPPWTAWQHAPDLGGPQHLPLQHDAAVNTRTVTPVGIIRCANTTISVGAHRAGQRLTIVRDGQHLTIYDTDGTPLGHLVIDPTKKHQGRLTHAA